MPRGKEAKKNIKVKQEELDRLHSLLEVDDEQEMEKEIKKVLKDRRQKVHRQVAEMESKNKRLLMWAGVTIIMLVIVSFWVVKFNAIITRPIISTNQEIQDIDFAQARESFTTTIEKIRMGIEDIKQQAQEIKKEKGENNDKLTEDKVLEEVATGEEAAAKETTELLNEPRLPN